MFLVQFVLKLINVQTSFKNLKFKLNNLKCIIIINTMSKKERKIYDKRLYSTNNKLI